MMQGLHKYMAKIANASVHPVKYYYYKTKGDTNDLNEIMECAV